MPRTPLAILGALALALVLPATAPATLSEVGVIGATTPPTVPSCPSRPCEVVSRTTGFQVKIGSTHNPLSTQKEGRIVAWTITLAKPTASQISFLDSKEGGAAEATIAVLAPQPKPNLTYKLVAQGTPEKLQPYFGETVEFPLETTIPVKKGDVVALAVPTWAPALALGLENNTSWRASRSKSECSKPEEQTNDTVIGASVQYYCLYQTARLTYSATLISTP